MANIIKAKRSAVPGKVPATTDLDLGEIAINTYDGKAYIKKNVGGTEFIVPLGGGSGSGDVIGPAVSTDNAITRFDGASGQLIKNSTALLDDAGNATFVSILLGNALALGYGGTGAVNANDARSNLGLGTMATQNSNNVAITGGDISGITDLSIADGGTGASTASGARTNLGLGSLATLSSVDESKITNGAVSYAKLNSTEWARSLGTAGCAILAGGLLIQWGRVSSLGGGATTNITFSTAFPSACTGVQTCINTSGDINEIVQAYNVTTTGATLRNSNPGTLAVYWLAYGY